MDDLLTPKEVLTKLRIKDRHTLNRLVRKGKLERVDVSAGEKQARWRYRFKGFEPEVSEEALKLQEVLRRHGL
jgi:hypothetical protein